MFTFPELPRRKSEFVVSKGEVVVRAPAIYSKDLPWGKIPKTAEVSSWGRDTSYEVIVTDGIDENERGLFVLRNNKEAYSRYVSLGKDGTCHCEVVLPDETKRMMKESGWLQIRNILNQRVGPDYHQTRDETVDSNPEHDISRMTRVIESLGDEMTSLTGRKVIFKSTGRLPILRHSGIVRERLARQFSNMRNLEKKFTQKPIPGMRICKQYGYVRFPGEGPDGDDLEYLFMEQVDGKSVPFEKHNIMYTGGVSDEYRRDDPASFVCKFVEVPHLKQVVDFIDGENKKAGRYVRLRYSDSDEISMEDLRILVEEYVGVRYDRNAKLGDFYPRNLLLEKSSDGNDELVIIDQYPHHQ